MEHRERLQRLQARAKTQGMSDNEFVALVRAVNDRALELTPRKSFTERLDEIETGLQNLAEIRTVLKPESVSTIVEVSKLEEPSVDLIDLLNSHRFMK